MKSERRNNEENSMNTARSVTANIHPLGMMLHFKMRMQLERAYEEKTNYLHRN